MITNTKPKADANDFAIWRRLILLPFEKSFVEDPKKQNEKLIDYDLPEKLKTEYPGILAWAVRGCLKWQAEGLQPPDKVKMATSDYKTENDTIQQFISECCIVTPSVRINPTDLYESYQSYCGCEGLELINKQGFFKQIKTKFESEKNSYGRWYVGITTKLEAEI